MRFVGEHRHDRFTTSDGVDAGELGVEPICAVLTEHGAQIAPSTYWAAVNRDQPCESLVASAFINCQALKLETPM